jgi:hypothetical protein
MQPRQCADSIMGVMQRLAHQRSNLSIAALCGARQFIQWRHYPAHDAVDATHDSEFYYHAHSGGQHADGEHGHFHVFTRPGGRRRFHHLIGISMNQKGLPTRLFLTNQWVTGEHWAAPQMLESALQQFHCQLQGRLSPVSRWVSAMVHLYRPNIQALHQRRYHWHQLRQQATGSRSHLTDQRWHVICETPIDLLQKLAKF